MRILRDHLALALYAPAWIALTFYVYSCCGLSR